MKKLNFLLTWSLFLGILVSCGDKDEDPEPAPAVEIDYWPTTKGSTWTYGGSNPYTNTTTGETKVIDGRTYYEFETKAGSQTSKSYFLKEKGVYWGVGFLPNVGDVQIPILKEETPIGKPWEQSAVMNGINTKMTFTITEKDISKTVEGKEYKNVIHVKMVSSYTFMGTEFDAAVTTHYYFAKGVGLILTDAEGFGQIPLKSYNIK